MLNLGVRCQIPCRAPSVRGAIVLPNYVVLDCDQFYFCRVAFCWSSGGDVESSVLLLLHVHTHLKHTQKKKFAPVTRMVVVTRKVVTYGIRAGSTHDLGFATGSVDMIMMIILSLIEPIIVCR